MGSANTSLSSTRSKAASRTRSRLRSKTNIAGWLFALPWTVIFLLFLLGPIFASLVLSFTGFGLVNMVNPFSAQFVGLQNYVKLMQDDLFLKSAFNTAFFVLVGVPLNVAIGLLIAVGLNQGVGYIKAIFRVGYYLPVVTSIVAVAVVWRLLLDAETGLVNNLLGLINLPGGNWLGDPVLAMPAIIAMAVWRNIGGAMIIFLAGLQGIDPALYEAARIDGANALSRFRYITLPLLRPTMLFVVVTTSIGFLQVFAEPFVMTRGGPLNQTLTISIYLYQQGFNFFNQGYASAMAYVLFIAVALIAIVQFRLLRPQT